MPSASQPHLGATLASLRNGINDPTTVTGPDWVARATIGPDGLPTALHARLGHDGTIEVTTPGADPVIVGSHPLFGDDDPGHDVVAVHPAVASAMSAHGDVRLARTDTPYHELIPAVLGQRVTAREAIGQWGRICRLWGDRVEIGGIQLHTPPRPDRLLSVPYHEWHLLGVERRRAETVRNVARHGERLLTGWRTELNATDRTQSLRLIPGVGVWTAAVAGHIAFGDPDALEFGDFHVKNTVAWALEGRARGTDEEMHRAMEPYAGQRKRVLTWLTLAGWSAPARGPRRRILDVARL
ncbi:MAG: DNA-3-methyladenine glycosylase family protein [Ilumatobacteraceae bacterium]